jgi:four helix bundle protein
MSTIKSFMEIKGWQAARDLSREIFELTSIGPFSKDFGLKDQINRASGSVMDNIAEGFDRGGTREFLQFLSYSRGSCGEVRSQLFRAYDRKYIDENVFLELEKRTIEVGKIITGLMNYLLKTKIKGYKYQNP